MITIINFEGYRNLWPPGKVDRGPDVVAEDYPTIYRQIYDMSERAERYVLRFKGERYLLDFYGAQLVLYRFNWERYSWDQLEVYPDCTPAWAEQSLLPNFSAYLMEAWL